MIHDYTVQYKKIKTEIDKNLSRSLVKQNYKIISYVRVCKAFILEEWK